MLVAWFVLPLVLGALSVGCGLFLEYVAGLRVPGALLLPLGFSALMVAALFATTNGATARLAGPLVIAFAVAGFGASLSARGRKPDFWSWAVAVVVFLAYGAPVLLSGTATFAGYIKLDDTANWLGLTDRLIEHGRTVSGLAPSTYRSVLSYYFGQYGYPVGAFVPLGVGHELVGSDLAWLYQPYLSFLAAMLALGIYGLVGRLLSSRPLRAAVAFVSAQPALLYGYALWGGVKELAVAVLLVLVAALVPVAVARRVAVRNLLPLATATAALIGVLNLSGGTWLAPVLLPVLVIGLRLRGRAFARVAAAFLALTALLSLPSLLSARAFLNAVSLNVDPNQVQSANLLHSLDVLQMFGIWPVGDFRLRPSSIGLTYCLIAILVVAAAGGATWAWKRGAWEVPLYVAAAAAGCALTLVGGSAWLAGKALATASPAFLVAGMVGSAGFFRAGRRIVAAVLAAVISGGVLWSNALAYHDVWLAPRGQLAELEQIGERFAGDGPALVNEFEFYGDRYFLRNLQPEGVDANILNPRSVPLISGQATVGYADTDQLELGGILADPTLVLVRSPAASRPPSPYNLVWSGRFYEVWQRPTASSIHILSHLPLGGGDWASAVPDCAEVLRLASEAVRAGGVLKTVVRPPSIVLPLSQTTHFAGWDAFPPSHPDVLYDWAYLAGSPDLVYPSGSGTVIGEVDVPSAGRYGVWLGGSFPRPIKIWVDGRFAGEGSYQLDLPRSYMQLGDIDLGAGQHTVVLRSDGQGLRPGSGGPAFPLGPLILSTSTADLPVTTEAPSDARSLCGKSLDWIEVATG